MQRDINFSVCGHLLNLFGEYFGAMIKMLAYDFAKVKCCSLSNLEGYICPTKAMNVS